jgi:hypothetical protein
MNYLPAAAVTAIYMCLWVFVDVDPLRDVPASTKGNAYQTLAGIAGAALGLGVVSFSVLFAVAPRSRLAAVVAFGRPLRVWLTGSFIALGMSLIGFGILLPIDNTGRATGARYVAVALTAIVATALAELIYLANRVYRSLSKELALDLSRHVREDDEFEVVVPDEKGHKIPRRQIR